MSWNGWLINPLEFHSSRAFECGTLTPEQCAYYRQWWHFWYQADHVFGQGSIYFCVAVIGLFVIGRILYRLMPMYLRRKAGYRAGLAATRYLSYRSFYFKPLSWYSPPLGTILIGAVAFGFYFGMMLGPKPYYWPTYNFGHSADYGNSPPLATRSGWMALGLLPFTIALAMKLNLISQVTGISHERLQVFHRWSAFLMLVLGLVHTFPFIVLNIQKGDMQQTWRTNYDYQSGVATVIPQAYLTFFSFKFFRDRFYEFFKFTHILVAVIFVVMFFIHCSGTLTSWNYFIATGVVYFLTYIFALLRTYVEYKMRVARLTMVTPNLLCIEIEIPNLQKGGTHWRVGQHVFLRFISSSIGFHCTAAHPFTICSHSDGADTSSMKFYVRPHGGVILTLASMARENSKASVRVFLDGPYGGMQETQLSDFKHSIIIVGGSGAGFSLPLIEDWFLRCCYWETSRTSPEGGNCRNDTDIEEQRHSSKFDRSLHIIFATRKDDVSRWYFEEFDKLLKKYPNARSATRISLDIHTTVAHPLKNRDDQEATVKNLDAFHLPDTSTDLTKQEDQAAGLKSLVSYHRSRPDLPGFLTQMADIRARNGERTGVAVCGPQSMIFDVKNACANAQTKIFRGRRSGEFYLHSERFGW